MASWGRSDKLYNITAFGYEFARHAASEMRRMLLPCVGRARCGSRDGSGVEADVIFGLVRGEHT